MKLTKVVTDLASGEAIEVPLTPEEIQELEVRQANVKAEEQARTDLESRLLDIAKGAVGIKVNNLSTAQRNALIVALLWKSGALNSSLEVKPLSEWLI